MTETTQDHFFPGMPEAGDYLRGEGFRCHKSSAWASHWRRSRDGALAVARRGDEGVGVTIKWGDEDE